VITYASVGSSEGIRRFISRKVSDEDKVDFGASDAAPQDSEIAQVTEGVVMVPVTAGGVALAYNLPGVTQELKLSRRAYAGIFLGEIKNWDDRLIAAANPGVKLPKLTIVTMARQDASGTTFTITKNLDAISEKWRSRYGASTLVDWPGRTVGRSSYPAVGFCCPHWGTTRDLISSSPSKHLDEVFRSYNTLDPVQTVQLGGGCMSLKRVATTVSQCLCTCAVEKT